MGYKHDAEEIVAGGVELVLEEGLSRLSFGRLAARMGMSDRSIVYYFPTKSDLAAAVVAKVGERLFLLVGQAFGDEPHEPMALARRAWPVLATEETDTVFKVWFELVGLAAAGIEPYPEIARAGLEGWVEWLVPRIDATSGDDPRAGATAVVGMIEGLLLVRGLLGPEGGDAAARGLGIVSGE